MSERILGPLELVWAEPEYPAQGDLCETHVAARLVNGAGLPVTIMGSVGGAQPDRQEVTVKGSKMSRRISEFVIDTVSSGGRFEPSSSGPVDTRATGLQAQLDDFGSFDEWQTEPPCHDPRGASSANLDRGHFVRPAR